MMSAQKTSLLDIGKLIHSDHSALSAIAPDLLDTAKDHLNNASFPTTRTEAWKYTRTTRISSKEWQLREVTTEVDIAPYRIENIDCNLVVFVNGFLRNDLCKVERGLFLLETFQEASDLKSLIHQLISDCSESTDIFELLSVSHCTDGMALNVTGVVSKPFHFIFLQTGKDVFACPMLIVNCAENAKLDLIVSHHSSEGSSTWFNASLHVNLEKGSTFNYYKVQNDSSESFSHIMESIHQSDDSTSNLVNVTLSGGWIRNNVDIRVDGSGCEANLAGCYAPTGKEHLDNHTVVDHIKARSNSNELYKGVVFDQGRAVFNGKVFVREQAQKTNAYQQNANIVMSDDAVVNSKPELEIYADDVKCSHGSTTGQIDEEALFYLRSRGLSEMSARKLMVSAFFADVLDRIELKELRSHVVSKLIENGVMLS